jgi:hypothetical protein
MGSTKYPKGTTGYVNIKLDKDCAEALYVALVYALGIQPNKKGKKKKKKKKNKDKTTPKPTPKPAKK